MMNYDITWPVNLRQMLQCHRLGEYQLERGNYIIDINYKYWFSASLLSSHVLKTSG
jgi:hypothetical protein